MLKTLLWILVGSALGYVAAMLALFIGLGGFGGMINQ